MRYSEKTRFLFPPSIHSKLKPLMTTQTIVCTKDATATSWIIFRSSLTMTANQEIKRFCQRISQEIYTGWALMISSVGLGGEGWLTRKNCLLIGIFCNFQEKKRLKSILILQFSDNGSVQCWRQGRKWLFSKLPVHFWKIGLNWNKIKFQWLCSIQCVNIFSNTRTVTKIHIYFFLIQ